IVGGGPAGLSAAYQLARRGFRVSIYESQAQLGGLLRYGIPSYRLDKSILDAEIARIVNLGVTVHLNTSIADKGGLEALRAEHDAVFLATGATKSKVLPGLDYSQPWVRDGAKFLAQTNAGEACDLGRHLVVIGGGSAGIDVARTARRLGRDVTVLALEPDDLLPAQRTEVVEAREEGIRFVCGAMMQKVDAGADGLTINCVEVAFTPGAARGQFTIAPVDGSAFTLAADAIIPSIGQDADLKKYGDLLASAGPVIAHDENWQTSSPGIFAGGDLTSMDRFVTEAIGMGKEAAIAIARFVDPEQPALARQSDPAVPFKVINTAYHSTDGRESPAHVAVEQRLKSFGEVQQRFTKAAAEIEAKRCFSCGTCIYCDNCYFYCPDMAITKLDQGYEVKLDYCKGCGLCVAECPTGAINMAEDLGR
ncbi:MAG: FAD-dependent oxidoreductase, partial [Rhodobacteraceae bacterium]|nr:FAD-dependent oxidoreductase [Paracoccaceae bacterium]